MRRTSLLVLLLLTGSGGLAAQSPASPPPARGLLAEGAFLVAVDEVHVASRALSGDLGAAEANRMRASLLAEPRLEVAREAPRDLARETTWGVAWSPPMAGRRRAVSVAEADVEAEAHRLAGRLLELRSEARAAYAAWAAAEARAALLAEHTGRLEALSGWMTARAEAGEKSLLAAWRLEIALRRSKIALSEARAAEAGWRERAAAWLESGDPISSATRTELPTLPEALAGLDAGTRPEVLEAGARLRQAESLEGLSRKYVEAPELHFGWKTVDHDPAAPDSDFSGPVFAIRWRIPLFDRRRADRLAAASAVAAAAAAEEWTARRARGELAAALVTYRELRRAALAARADLGGRDRVARAATASFELGESGVTELLDTLRALLEARLAALDLHAAALEAHRRLELAAGRPLTFGDLS